MKLTTLLILISILPVSATVYSQATKFNISAEQKQIVDILKEIEESSDFRFFYIREQIDVEKRVSLNTNNSTVEQVLDILFANQDVEYKVLEDNLILISPDIEKMSVVKSGPGVQQNQIKGKVVDANGEALPGVTVAVKGATQGTLTDANGEYILTGVSADATLQFSFVGMQSQEILVGNRTVIDVTLQEDLVGLSEVIVTGYSVERKKDIIGSVSVVDAEGMLSTPSGNITSQLQGTAAGVVVAASGDPGKAARVRIRGYGTFGESEPLYIIDGVPGDANRLNPNDIESIQILKDAASAAVYGARAANGVIIITTKQGKPGDVKVTLDSYYGMQYVGKKWFPDLLNAEEMGQLVWMSLEGGGYSPGMPAWNNLQYGNGVDPVIPEYIYVNDNGRKYGGAELEYLRTSNPTLFNYLVNPANYDLQTHQIVKSGDTNWFEETFNPAPIQSHQLTVSGGTTANSYLISVNYFDQSSVATEYSYFKRYNARANSVLSISDHLKIGENIQISYQKARDVSMVNSLWYYHPLIPVTDIAGNMAGSAAPNVTDYGGYPGLNPVMAPAREQADYNEGYGFFGNVFADLDLFKDLKLRSSFGFNVNNQFINNFYPFYYENLENNNPQPDRLEIYTRNMFNYVFTNTANYNKTWGDHSFKLLLGSEAVMDVKKTVNAVRYNYTADLQKYEEFLILDAGSGTQGNSGTIGKSTLFSLFGRVDYIYNNKYMINATVRRDGSSKFGSENRFGVFPSVAVGWRLSEEPFMESLDWLSDLKLRGSYGIIGNLSGLSPTNQYSTYTSRDLYKYPITGENNTVANSYVLVGIGNPAARWEKTKITNAGFDATLFEGKVTLSAEYYQRLTDDLLVQNQAPQTGSIAQQPFVNVGSMRNRGVDISASYRGELFGELQYDLTANFSSYRNLVLKVLDNELATITVGNNRTEAGYPMGYFYGFVTDGFFNTQAEVDAYKASVSSYLMPRLGGWRIKDINNDGKVNDLDRTMIGSPHPDFQVNGSLSLAYRNFDFYTTVMWSQGGDVYNSLRGALEGTGTGQARPAIRATLYDSWTPENINASLPRRDVNAGSAGTTDHLIEDATYVRVRTMQLGYSLPSMLLSKLRIDNLRVYVQVQNPFTWVKEFTGIDPDAVFSGNVRYENQYITDLETRTTDMELGNVVVQTPTPQQVLFGINVSF